MARYSFRSIEEDSKIDMTPMLDIVFIMLIFFIVTASFLKESGIPLEIPEGTPPTTLDKVSLIIHISDNNDVWFGKRKIDIRAIEANLKREMSLLDNPSVTIRVHPESRTNMLLQVADHVRAAGVFDFIVTPLQNNNK